MFAAALRVSMAADWPGTAGCVPSVLQRALALDLLNQRGEELLLQLDPAEVAAVTDAVPGPDERQCLVAGDQVPARAQVQVAVRVVDGLRQADLDAAERIHHRAERVEVELDEVIHPDLGQVLDRGHRAGRSAQVHRAVDDRLLLRGHDAMAVAAYPTGGIR
jgi:hypothetical protein